MFGIGLRRPYFDSIVTQSAGVDFLEIISENFMDFGGRPKAVLQRSLQHFPIVPHGVALSIGSIDPINKDYLQTLKALVVQTGAPWFSDHLCFSSAFGVYYHDLLPLPFTEEAIKHVVKRVQYVQDFVGTRLLLENPSYYVRMPGAEMSEAEFLSEVAKTADCGILLDVNNVYVNACNHAYDAQAFIAALPHDRIFQLHMAGHDASGEFLIDTHGAPVCDDVFDLYRFTTTLCPQAWTLLEWDNDLPTLEVLKAELQKIRKAHRGFTNNAANDASPAARPA
jgi:uncharacterized protein